MADSSWDNGGLPPQAKRTSTGMKVLMGCGIATLLALLTCGVGGAVLGHFIRKNPQGFEQSMEGFVRGFMQKDWDRLRALVDQLQTDDGARAVYRANPDLQRAHSTETAFLEAVRGWRPRLAPLPAEAPMEGRRRHRRNRGQPEAEVPGTEAPRQPSVDIQKIFGTTRIRCTYPKGGSLAVTFDGERVKSIEVE